MNDNSKFYDKTLNFFNEYVNPMSYSPSKIPPLEHNINQTAPILNYNKNDHFSSSSNDFGILQFNPDISQGPPKFTESFTIDAMNRLGITPEELIQLTEEEKKSIPGDEKVRQQIINEFERRRIDAVEQIKEKREELLIQTQRQNQFDLKYRSARRPSTATLVEQEFSKIKRAQKKEIERIIAAELVRRESILKETKRQQTIEQNLKLQAETKQKKYEEEQQKRQQREQKVQERYKLREMEIAEQQKQQIEKEERRQQREIERDKIRKAEFARQSQLKEMKLKKFHDDRILAEQIEQKKRDERSVLLKQRELRLMKQKEDELAQLKEHNRALMEKAVERLNLTHKREKEEIERKTAKMIENENNVQKRLDQQKKQKMLSLIETRKKNEERLQRSLLLTKKLEEEDMKKKEKLQIRNDQAVERYHQIVKDREKKAELARLDNEEKTMKMFEKKRKADQLEQQKLIQFEEKMAIKAAKFEEVKKMQEQELKNKNAFQWMKQKIGEENNGRLQRRIEYENHLATQLLNKKMSVVERIQQDRQDEIRLVAMKSSQLQRKKDLILEEVRKMTNKNGELNIEMLAAKFDIDIEEVRKKYIYRKPISSTFSPS